VPWKVQSAAFDVAELVSDLAGSPVGSAHHDLLTALKHARARVDDDRWASPAHVRYAQAVLEIAVEWSMPAVERWAVAWLAASSGSQLRLRWSSRSRDGRARRDGLAPSPVAAIAPGSGRVIIGCRSGYVAGWTDDAGLDPIGQSEDAVWAIAACGDRVLAAGAHGHFITSPEDWVLPSLRESKNAAVEVTAISLEGHVACGDNSGRVLICPARGRWSQLARPRDGSRALAMCFDQESAVWVIWKDGWVSEAVTSPNGEWEWRRQFKPWPGKQVVAAAFDRSAGRLAIGYADGEASVVHLTDMRLGPGWDRPDIPYPDIRAVAWSPGGLLALSGREALLVGEPGGQPEQIRGEGVGGLVAFPDDDHLVTAQGRDIVDWAVREAGSDIPDPYVQDAITAVAIDPRNPSCTMAGTQRGRLLHYDGRGSVTLRSAGEPVGGPVHQLVRLGDDWLVAAHTGAYRLAPFGDPVRLRPGPLDEGPYMCWAVAVAGEDSPGQVGVFAGRHQVRTVSGAPLLTLDAAARDIRSSTDGALAAIDTHGLIRVRDGAGGEWSPPEPPPRAGVAYYAGWRLLATDGNSVIVWNPYGKSRKNPDGEVFRFSRYGEYSRLCQVPEGAVAALCFDRDRILVACPERGVGLAEVAGHGHGSGILGVNTRVMAVDTDGIRVVVAAGKRVAGYDLMEPVGEGTGGVIPLRAALTDGRCRVTLSNDSVIELDPAVFAALRETDAGRSKALGEIPEREAIPAEKVRQFAAGLLDKGADLALRQQSELVANAGRVGDDLWRNGLNLAVDRARGDDPDRPVRLEWSCDQETDDVPWELVYPAALPLGWFDEPAVTSVRSIRPRTAGPRSRRGQASSLMARHRMLVIRGTGVELVTSDEAYTQTSRRTRLSNLTMLSSQPRVISSRDDLDLALSEPADILQVWAHCGPTVTRFSDDAWFETAELADRIAARVSRLVVIVGCRSGALGRALAERGVEAVVAMRVEVYSRTIQPLVADLISLVLGGIPVDLAFAEALRSYVLTGQPGAAAVPMLYLAAGSSGELFTSPTAATLPIP
jgi:hypothetical protein